MWLRIALVVTGLVLIFFALIGCSVARADVDYLERMQTANCARHRYDNIKHCGAVTCADQPLYQECWHSVTDATAFQELYHSLQIEVDRLRAENVALRAACVKKKAKKELQ